jgi:hypothetical protein
MTKLVKEIKELERSQLLARIEILEKQLAAHGLPLWEQSCECCGKMYMPYEYNVVRCSFCLCCYKPKDSNDWIKGNNCPGRKFND